MNFYPFSSSFFQCPSVFRWVVLHMRCVCAYFEYVPVNYADLVEKVDRNWTLSFLSTTFDADLNWRTVFYTILIAWIIDRLSYLEVSNVCVYLFMGKCRNNIQISSSHISLTDVIFTEVFEATLDIYNVYNMLFWSPTFYHQLRFKVLTNLEIRRFFFNQFLCIPEVADEQTESMWRMDKC